VYAENKFPDLFPGLSAQKTPAIITVGYQSSHRLDYSYLYADVLFDCSSIFTQYFVNYAVLHAFSC
jgi:hypothetical protein